MTNVWHHWPGIDEEVAAIFDPFGNAVHTALSFPVLGEDVLVVGAGPIGLMAAAVARHAGARFIVVSEPNAFRRELAAADGRDPRRRSRRARRSGTSRRELGMVEGFDVVLEMSGNAGRPPRRARRTWPTAAGWRSSASRPTEIPIDVSQVVFNQLTLRGHLRPGDVRDLVQDVGDAPVGARHPPGDHPSLLVPRPRGRLRGGPQRRLGQGDHGLDRSDDDDRPTLRARSARVPRRGARRPPQPAPVPAAPGDVVGPGPDRVGRRARG